MSDYVGCFIAAAMLTAASIAAQVESGALFPHSSIVPGPKDVNSAVWETFRVFYAGIIGAAGDSADWPNPARSAVVGPVAINPSKN